MQPLTLASPGTGSPRSIPRLLHARADGSSTRHPVQDALVPAQFPARHDPAGRRRGLGDRAPAAGPCRPRRPPAALGGRAPDTSAGEAYQLNFRFAADHRNPYVYAHTPTDTRELAAQMERLAQGRPRGTT